MKRSWVHYSLAFALWLVSTALTVLNIILLRRALLAAFITVSEKGGDLRSTGALNHWTVEALDQFGILLVSALGLIFVLFCEPFYRNGIECECLAKRFLRVTAVQAGLLIVSAMMLGV